MRDPTLNCRWCRLIAEELAAVGVQRAVLCPGSRDVPLLWAFDRQPRWRCTTAVDERAAAFFALGLIRSTRRPVAVVVTSGSAVGNLAPATMEAAHAGLPLILVTADRPAHLHGREAPQTTPQTGLLRDHADVLDLGQARDGTSALRRLRTRLAKALTGLRRPLQINVPLDEPLVPLHDPAWTPATVPPAILHQACGPLRITSPLPATPRLPRLPSPCRGLIVAGWRCPLTPGQVARLARRTGYPVVADAVSGLRRPGMPHLVCRGDDLLAGPLAEERPDLILRLGPAPVARPVWSWLARQTCPVVRLDDHRIAGDVAAPAFLLHRDLSDAALTDLAQRLPPGDPAWRRQWLAADQVLATTPPTTAEDAAVAAVLALPGFDLVHLANSLAVRLANRHLRPSRRHITGNRGLAGIDGTVATFFGALTGLNDGSRGLLLIGDQALLHDAGALALLPRHHHGLIVVLNNGGGGIFDRLPVARWPAYRRLVRQDRRWSFAGLARQFGLAQRRLNDPRRVGCFLSRVSASGWAVFDLSVTSPVEADSTLACVAKTSKVRP